MCLRRQLEKNIIMQNLDEIAAKLAGNLSAEQTRQRWEARQNGAQFARPETSDAERAYWQRVFSEPTAPQTLFVTRSTRQEMEYETARRKVWALMQLRAAHISDLENRQFEWEMSPDFAAAVRALTKYFINDPTAEHDCNPLPLTKGLFIYGAVGTGKTELMHIMQRFATENNLTKAFQFSSLSKVYTDAKASADFDPIAQNVCFERCFDEFGRYVGAVKRYGDDLDINEAILEQRYERFKRYGQLTHLVANLAPNETADKFSPMLVDRVRSMCTGVYFKGESKRK